MNLYEVIIRLVLAVVIGGAVGYEREFKNRPAGFRTHILVCVGAVVVSLIQMYSLQDATDMILKHPELASGFKADIGRLGAQVISGIGFLGAGTIIHEKGSVKGLTTAASLWVVACIGLAIGLGYYYLSAFAAICVVIVLISLKRFETRFLDKNDIVKLEVKYVNKREMLQEITAYFSSRDIEISCIEFSSKEEPMTEDGFACSEFTILLPKYIKEEDVIKDLISRDEIKKVSLV